MSLDVRREAVLSRWEIQVTRLRAESLQEAILVASIVCVMEGPFEVLGFVFCEVLGRGRRRVVWLGGDRRWWQNPRLQGPCPSHGESKRRQVGQG